MHNLAKKTFSSFCGEFLNQGACVIARLDINVPFSDGRILDETRINVAVNMLKHLHQHRLILLSHWGRPKAFTESESLKILLPTLEKKLGRNIHLANSLNDISSNHQVTLLDNIRFFREEKENDAKWASKLAGFGDVYINEAFSCSHRNHASIIGLPKHLPGFFGPAFEQEWGAIQKLRTAFEENGGVAIIGGSKISTKIGVLRQLLNWCDYVMIGGGMGNTFLAAQGMNMANSLVEHEQLDTARALLKEYGQKIKLPQDGVEIDSYTVSKLPEHAWGDVGPQTTAAWSQHIQKAQTIFWNGPVGIYEKPPLDQGSLLISKLISQTTHGAKHGSKVFSVIGGGDTLAAAKGIYCSYSSPSGGAFLDALEGGSLPGVEAITNSSP